MSEFHQIPCEDDLKAVIKAAFDADFELSGGWGYTQALATVIHASTVHIREMEHMLASMRAYLEMSMTLDESSRYGSINLNEKNREQITDGESIYDKVTYTITAMKEQAYKAFIEEYKEHYGSEDFDLGQHFEARKKATLTREVIQWFEVSQVQK